jgi:uncharacterized protein
MRHIIAALTALLLAGSANAASFDCARAASADEHAVCNIRALNDRDVKMATLYGLDIRLVPMGSRDAIKRDQAIWLNSRRACRADTACLTRAYDRRIAALQAVIDTRVYPHGPF